MKMTKNYQLFINGTLYNVYNTLSEATKIIASMKIIEENDFTYELKKEVNVIKVLRSGTRSEDFSNLKNRLISKTRAKKRSKKSKNIIKDLENKTDKYNITSF